MRSQPQYLTYDAELTVAKVEAFNEGLETASEFLISKAVEMEQSERFTQITIAKILRDMSAQIQELD